MEYQEWGEIREEIDSELIGTARSIYDDHISRCLHQIHDSFVQKLQEQQQGIDGIWGEIVAISRELTFDFFWLGYRIGNSFSGLMDAFEIIMDSIPEPQEELIAEE